MDNRHAFIWFIWVIDNLIVHSFFLQFKLLAFLFDWIPSALVLLILYDNGWSFVVLTNVNIFQVRIALTVYLAIILINFKLLNKWFLLTLIFIFWWLNYISSAVFLKHIFFFNCLHLWVNIFLVFKLLLLNLIVVIFEVLS